MYLIICLVTRLNTRIHSAGFANISKSYKFVNINKLYVIKINLYSKYYYIMTSISFAVIPLADINSFLSYRGYPINDNVLVNYMNVWDIINNNTLNALYVPVSISDWLIALNLRSQNIVIPVYKTTTILTSSDSDLQDLTRTFNLPSTSRERIIRILGYLGSLNNDMNVFDKLPLDAVKNIISYLDCETIFLLCKLSANFCDTKFPIDELLRTSLYRSSKFNTNKYDTKKLMGLCKFTDKINISTGYNYSLVLTSTGQIYAFGINTSGQLGLGDNVNRREPVPITKFNDNDNHNFIQVSAGHLHSVALTNNGSIYVFGSNGNGQLGLITDNIVNIPTLNSALNNIKHISAGSYHTLALNNNGSIYAFGFNSSGQLGLGNNTDKYTPTMINDMPNIIAISAGDNYSLILNDSGEVYAFGSNLTHQLGIKDGIDKNTPTIINGLANIVAISAGEYHSLVLNNKGQVYAFGFNGDGRLGLGDKVNRKIPVLIEGFNDIISISAGQNFSLILSNNNKVYSFGFNLLGQLGLGDVESRNIPTLVDNLTDKIAIQISAGTANMLVLAIDGQVYGCGSNFQGQLGLKEKSVEIPIAIMSIDI